MVVQRGRESEAFQYVPSEPSGTIGGKGEMIYGISHQGWFYVKRDSAGLLWDEEWPVFKISQNDAQAYAQYLSKKQKKTWMLPDEFQWEKAARGVDKRLFPWGNFLDSSWTCMRHSIKGNQQPQSVYASSIDISPFGVYGMGGNARDMTSTLFSMDGSASYSKKIKGEDNFYVVRGGSWYDNSQFIRSCSRSSEHQKTGSPHLSFRLIRYPDW